MLIIAKILSQYHISLIYFDTILIIIHFIYQKFNACKRSNIFMIWMLKICELLVLQQWVGPIIRIRWFLVFLWVQTHAKYFILQSVIELQRLGHILWDEAMYEIIAFEKNVFKENEKLFISLYHLMGYKYLFYLFLMYVYFHVTYYIHM